MNLSDKDMIETREHYFFIHKVFGHFFKDVLDYFSVYLYPRFEWTVVGTYDKAVEYIQKKQQLGAEIDKPNLPALILNPTGDFNIADAIAGGKQLWRFPNLAPGILKRLFEPIYEDNNILVTPGFSRFKGEIELIMLLNSFYEYCDIRVYLIQIFGGTDRYIYPRWFSTYIILPDEFLNYEYENIDGTKYKIDWDGNGASDKIINTIDKTKKIIPCTIKPIFKLTSLNDGSTRYGNDRLAEWRLTATIEYEIEIPTTLILESDTTTLIPPKLNFELSTTSAFSHFNDYHEENNITQAPETAIINTGEIKINSKNYHIVTNTEFNLDDDIIINLPEQINNQKLIKIQIKSGLINYGSEYEMINNGTAIKVKKSVLKLEENDIIEIYTYKLDPNPLGGIC